MSGGEWLKIGVTLAAIFLIFATGVWLRNRGKP